MKEKNRIFAIVGSASRNSASHQVVTHIADIAKDDFVLTIYNDLKLLHHFDPEQSTTAPPTQVIRLRNEIEKADGILICTPEYIFSIPSGLKNAIEWCVSTTVFSNKPCGLITASASGQKGNEELQIIMKAVMATFTSETTLLIQGIKGKINEHGRIIDENTNRDLLMFYDSFKALICAWPATTAPQTT
jgi:chromate reductase, NAD(P)H dehydrogenase (quinone)